MKLELLLLVMSQLFERFMEFCDTRQNRLNLVDLSHFIRVKFHIVSLFDSPQNLRKCRLGGQQPLLLLLSRVNVLDSIAVPVQFVQLIIDKDHARLAELKHLSLLLAELKAFAGTRHCLNHRCTVRCTQRGHRVV